MKASEEWGSVGQTVEELKDILQPRIRRCAGWRCMLSRKKEKKSTARNGCATKTRSQKRLC
jgi:hypothetical protein